MFGCAAVASVPVNNVPLTLPALTLPVTLKLVNVPTLVMFGCAFVVTVAAVFELPDVNAYVALATVPVTFAPVSCVSPLPLPVNLPVLAVMFAAVILPFTFNPVSVPTLVMLLCPAIVTLPA